MRIVPAVPAIATVAIATMTIRLGLSEAPNSPVHSRLDVVNFLLDRGSRVHPTPVSRLSVNAGPSALACIPWASNGGEGGRLVVRRPALRRRRRPPRRRDAAAGPAGPRDLRSP